MKNILALALLLSPFASLESKAQAPTDIAFELSCSFYNGRTHTLELGVYNEQVENRSEQDDHYQLTACGLNQSQTASESEEDALMKNSSWTQSTVGSDLKTVINLEKKCSLELPSLKEISEMKGRGSIKSVPAYLNGSMKAVGSCLFIPLQLGVISGGNQ